MSTIQPPAGYSRGMKLPETRLNREVAHGETNINVVVRCRGRNEREVRENTPVVVSTNGVKGTTVDLAMGPRAPGDLTFSFDKVFSPAADQAMIFNEVAAPILEEVLGGFNCTIFVYGQTGTGKTYTMSGDISDQFPLPEGAGIIPRFLRLLFAKLNSAPGTSAQEITQEHSVKVSFIELYNEQLRDLLSADDSIQLKMFDGDNKKGHAATMVQGIEEYHITSASEGLRLLQAGTSKRQIAATNYNDFSSRSHTIFTVMVKQTTGDGGEVISGKLSLVDLAGSENIQRSGAQNSRAAEAGLINKSLLTLGRVINALVEKSKHIPYRESKLTRLLRDSLGGETKTCIVATLSPAESSFEETNSTLNYASRAKSIQNKPQLNQMLSKKTMLKELIEEITRLKSDLIATRLRNGIHLSQESYDEMIALSESRRLLAQEQGDKIQGLEHNLRSRDQELFVSETNFNSLNKENQATKSALEKASRALEQTEGLLRETKQNLEDEKHVRGHHEKTEEELAQLGQSLISTLGQTTADIGNLHFKVQNMSAVNSANRQHWSRARLQVSDVTTRLGNRMRDFQQEQQALADSIVSQIRSFVLTELSNLETAKAELAKESTSFDEAYSTFAADSSQSKDNLNLGIDEGKARLEDMKEKIHKDAENLTAAADRIPSDILSRINAFHAQLQASQTALRADITSSFDDILQELEKQRNEADSLRLQIAEANAAVNYDGLLTIDKLQSMIDEDERMRKQESEDLKRRIEDLVDSTAKQQRVRWEAMGKLPESFRELHSAQDKVYNDLVRGDGLWEQRSKDISQKLVNSRDNIESTAQEGFMEGTKHAEDLRAITSSVHAQTKQAISHQESNLNEGMNDLCKAVDGIESLADQHDTQNKDSLQKLASTAKSCYAGAGETFAASAARVESFDVDVTQSTADLKDTIANLDPSEQICQPLIQLRERIESDTPEEYSSTGRTPPRKTYAVSTEIPRTERREELLARLRTEPTTGTEDAAPPLRTGGSNTGLVFADPPTVVDEAAPSTEQTTASGNNARGLGLRELDPNAVRLTEPSSVGIPLPKKRQRVVSAVSDLPLPKTKKRAGAPKKGPENSDLPGGRASNAALGPRATRMAVPRSLRSSRKTGQ